MGQQGKRYTEREREKAMALRATGMSIKDVAERLGCSINAVRSWEKAITSSDPEKMARLRLEKKAAFASKAWADCEAALRLISRRIRAASASMDELEKLIAEAARAGDISDGERRELLRKLSAVRIDDIGKLSTVMGVLYDKSALASGEATQEVNLSGKVKVEKFEYL